MSNDRYGPEAPSRNALPEARSAEETAGQVPSPARLWVITSVCIFAAEWLIMYGTEVLWELPVPFEIWLDPAALVAMVTPLLYLFLFRPMATQIAERRRAEEALRYSERKYSTLVEDSPTGIIMVRDKAIVFANPAFISLAHRSREILLQSDPYELIHPEDRERVSRIGAARLAGEDAPTEYECRLVLPSGESRWVALRPALVHYRDGDIVLATVLDVTARKNAEADLLRATASLRELSARLLAAQEEERKRVARELHDGVGQSLSAVKFMIERLVVELDPEGESQRMLLLGSAVRAIQAAVDEVRTMSMGLRPSILDDLGLVATLTWLSRDFSSAHPEMKLDRTVDLSERDVPDRLKIVIFRVLQEALNNSGKHSGARGVWVMLRRAGSMLVLEVRDDGKGFDPAVVKMGDGLRNMRERTELSGGRFSVSTQTDGGTAIRAEWPLTD